MSNLFETDRQETEKLPMLLSAKQLQEDIGIPRALTYKLLNSAEMPVVCLGTRKFMNKEKFLNILNENPGLIEIAISGW